MSGMCNREECLDEQREMAALLREYMMEFPAFRSKPEGSPGSDARKAQQGDIAREDRVVALLTRLSL